MLDRALSKIPSEKDKGKGSEAELHTLCIRTGGIDSSPKEDSWGGESEATSPRGKKRAASENWEVKAPKRGKTPLSGGSGSEGDVSPIRTSLQPNRK